MNISGEVEVSLANLPLSIKGSLSVANDSKDFYDSSQVKVNVEYIHRTEQILDLGPGDVNTDNLKKLVELGATHVVQSINYGASGLLDFESEVNDDNEE